MDVNCTGFEPSRSLLQTSKRPERLEAKAMRLPSGEYSAWRSRRVEPINFVKTGCPAPSGS